MPLRILHVTPYYEGAWAYGGIPRVVPLLAGGLADRGHDVVVCTTDVRDAFSRLPAAERRSGQRLQLKVFSNLSNRAAYHWQLFAPIRMNPYLRRNAPRFDVGHVHACHNLPGVYACRQLRRSGVPYVISPHGTAPRIERRRGAKWLFDKAFASRDLPKAHRVVAVSRAEEQQLLKLKVTAERIRLVPNPIDTSAFARLPQPGRYRRDHALEGRPFVLYLGRLSPRKRIDLLLEAFAKLDNLDAHLVVAGNDMGVLRPLRRLAQRLGVRGRTSFPGLLSGSSRLEALVDADCVVYPAEHEIFGLVPIEALLCGTPVVVADDSGCAEVISLTGGGKVIPAGDPTALAGAINDTLSTSAAATEAATQAAARRIRKHFAPALICAQLEAVYLETIATHTEVDGDRGCDAGS